MLYTYNERKNVMALKQDYKMKTIEKYYKGHLLSVRGDGNHNYLEVDCEHFAYFKTKEDVEELFNVLSDLFTAFETIGGFNYDDTTTNPD